MGAFMRRFLIFWVLLFFVTDCFSQELPLDFSSSNQKFESFGGSGFAFRGDPDDETNQVGQFFNDGLNADQGFYISLTKSIDLSKSQTIVLSFYSFDPNVHSITISLQNGELGSVVFETKDTAATSGWQHNIEFKFQPETGTYDRLSIYVDLGDKTPGTYLLDNINNGNNIVDKDDGNEEEPVYDVLIWSDEFDSSSTAETIDNSKWHHQTFPPSGDGSWFNGEEQHYTDRIDNSYQKDGFLYITLKRENFTSFGTTKAFTSARLNSKFAFTYGRVDVRAKLPEGDGAWPAIWTLGKNITETGGFWAEEFGTTAWPACGEIDIMEHGLGATNHTSSAIHTPSSFGNTINTSSQTLASVANNFYEYSMIWSPTKITFLVDDVPYYTYNPSTKNSSTWPFNLDQYLLLNVAMGGFAGPIDANFKESAMVIDYVRVYQSEAILSTQTINNKDLEVALYPNPVKNFLFIKSAENIENVTIYNAIGKKVLQQNYTSNTVKVNLGAFIKGMYFVKIYSLGKVNMKKIIIE
jgi:beta-glucanase (GH16 family)